MAKEALEETVDNDEDLLEIEIEDDIPEDEKPRREEGAPAEIPDDDDLEGYSSGVQKRLKKLTFEAREAERQRQATMRERDEAVKFAKSQQDEIAKLREQLASGQTSTVEHAKGRAQAEIAAAEREYKDAAESGDTDAMLAAQRKLIKSSNDLSRLEAWRPPAKQEAKPAPQPAQAQPAPPQLDERQKTWLAANTWFGQDSEMTGAAYGLHEKLVKSGVDPNSKAYYDKIDEGMRKRFPENFEDDTEEVTVAPKKKAPAVAPATRSGPTARKVTLTQSQVALAKRLGLTKEQYAAQLLKEQNNG